MGGSASRDEQPRRVVRLSQSYYLDETEVSIRAYRAYVRATRATEPTWPISRGLPEGVFIDPYPAHGLERGAATAYASWVGATLPTEAQWERAARGGREGWNYPWGPDASAMPVETAADAIVPVGASPPNPYGLRDLAGNVAEWCLDGYDPEAYLHLPAKDPVGPDVDRGVVRGGSGKSLGTATTAERLRVARRLALRPTGRYDDVGFRCAFTVP